MRKRERERNKYKNIYMFNYILLLFFGLQFYTIKLSILFVFN